ncbi:MAG TPA: uroporphyrinogen-III C-methyltransferase [Chloroflexota bacterium]
MRTRGMVSLVGAGPGDPELITVRALRCLEEADVVVYDRLIDPRILESVPLHAERIFVGKAAGSVVLSQRGIENLLIDRARQGKHVVRLKGGDPFLFGRGGEEIEALTAADIPYQVVPGVSSAFAVPASAGIPVTHRRLASTVTVVTGHEDPEKPQSSIDWEWLARAPGTLVILMGLERLDGICSRLMREGRSGDTPAAVIASGTLPQQRTVLAPLAGLADEVQQAVVRSPAIIVVGEVARFPEMIAGADLAALAEAV